MWGFELELKKSLRTKKFWLILVLILLIYAMAFREVRDNLEGATNPQEVLVTSVVGYIAVSAFLFIGLYALMAGATAVNSDLEDGTVRVSLSKPLGRVSYLLGKFLGQTVSIVVAMVFATLLSFAITKYYGLSLTASLVGDLILSNLLILLAMLQLLALGLLISTLIRSSNTALGLALVMFFVTGLVMPQVVDGFAEDKAKEEFGIEGLRQAFAGGENGLPRAPGRALSGVPPAVPLLRPPGSHARRVHGHRQDHLQRRRHVYG